MTKSTIYLLDDEAALVALETEMAELAGFSVQGYTRASDFFADVIVPEPGSLMVLDLQMPEMDGIEVMRRLAKTPSPPALILVSGHDVSVLASAEKLCRAHGLEVIASLSKPVSYKYLLQLFEQHDPVASQRWHDESHLKEEGFTVSDLLQAIRAEQLVLYFQPQIEIKTGKVVGVEALVRWYHPEKGLIGLEHLISLAEKSGVISELTHWVIDTAVNQEHAWRNAGLTMSVSVNISAADITSLMLPEQIARLLEANKLDPTRLTLEITESALIGELVTSLDILTRLRLKGIQLSIDDFGTGYSSLSQLHRIPFNELKIDRSFVSNMTTDKEALAIVKTCILLGHELNMSIVAEGVEAKAHLDLLKQMGCDYAQGYHVAAPMPGDDLIEWIRLRGLGQA